MLQWYSHRSRLLTGGFALLVLALTGCFGGGSSAEPQRLCLEIQASKELNLFDGQPHVVVVRFYPLDNATAFQATDVRDLVRGAKPAGLAGEPWQTVALPGQKLKVTEPLPKSATQLGIVADYYHGPSRVIVPSQCDSDARPIALSDSEIALAQTKEGK
jgi:type VI secretion system VasD/TssJ family lipoprotein